MVSRLSRCYKGTTVKKEDKRKKVSYQKHLTTDDLLKMSNDILNKVSKEQMAKWIKKNHRHKYKWIKKE